MTISMTICITIYRNKNVINLTIKRRTREIRADCERCTRGYQRRTASQSADLTYYTSSYASYASYAYYPSYRYYRLLRLLPLLPLPLLLSPTIAYYRYYAYYCYIPHSLLIPF